jgi:C-terminal processing protease CtpA/Prc
VFAEQTGGGLGMAIRDVDDGRVIVNFVLEGGPAAEEGIELGAEIIELNGKPIDAAVDEAAPWSGPYSTEHTERLQLLRYALRFPVDTEVEVVYQNPGDDEPTTVTLTTIAERASLSFSSFNRGLTGTELPIEYHVLPSGYMYVKIFSFFDDAHLTIILWERMLQYVNQNGIPGIILDMRQNGGGSGWLADQMAAYFFNEPLVTGATALYDEEVGDFVFDENATDSFVLAPENLRFNGPVAVMVGPACASACEFFSYDMTLQDRAVIVGQYPTAGLGGSVEDFFMPEGEVIRMTIGRAVDAEGSIHIEGQGVAPSIVVPVTEETLFSESDVVLDYAVAALDEALAPQYTVTDGGEIALGDEVTGEIAVGERVQYILTLEEDTTVDIVLGDESGQFDTYLRLYDTEGNLLAENDDAVPGEVFNSALTELEIPAGFTIIIEVGTFDDAGEGEYTLSVSETGG